MHLSCLKETNYVLSAFKRLPREITYKQASSWQQLGCWSETVNTGQGTELGSRAGCVTNWHVPLSEGHQNSPTARHPSCAIPLPWGCLGKCFSVASLRFPGLQGLFPELWIRIACSEKNTGNVTRSGWIYGCVAINLTEFKVHSLYNTNERLIYVSFKKNW